MQFRIVTAVSDSVGTRISFHYTTDGKIIPLHFRRFHTIGLFLESSSPHCVSQRTNKQDSIAVSFWTTEGRVDELGEPQFRRQLR